MHTPRNPTHLLPRVVWLLLTREILRTKPFIICLIPGRDRIAPPIRMSLKKYCDSSWEQILWLENRGMHFSRNPKGKLSKRTFGGHTLNFGETSAYRAVFEADRTGKGMMDTCWGESLKRNISFLNQSIGTELLFKAGRCVGCLVFKLKEGEFIRIFSGATVLATGGSGQVFKIQLIAVKIPAMDRRLLYKPVCR